MLVYWGLWNSDKDDYAVNDVVSYNDTKGVYRCLVDGTVASPTDPAAWQQLRPIHILREIIKRFMNLDDQQIWLYNQNNRIAPTKGLFVMIQLLSAQPFANNSKTGEDGMSEELMLNMQETYSVNIFSKDDSAAFRNQEVLQALQSQVAKEWQEIFQFKVPRTSSNFVNISELEGAEMLNRYAITISLLTSYYKKNIVDYYDEFENTIIYNN